MDDSTAQLKQMSLFDDGSFQADDTPLPLLIAATYGFSLQHHTTDDDTLVYAVQDWIRGVAQQSDTRKLWNALKKRLKKSGVEMSTRSRLLPYKASDGKTYQRDFATDETLYLIAQRMDTNTGIRNDVLAYLAKSGAFVDNLRVDPESAEMQITARRRAKSLAANNDPAWNAAREIGVITRKQFTAMLVNLNPSVNVGQATNDVYRGVFNADAAGLRDKLGIGAKANPRDHMSRLALIYTMAAEEACRIELSSFNEDDAIPVSLIRSIVIKMAKLTGLQAQDMARALGVDTLTGNPLLKA